MGNELCLDILSKTWCIDKDVLLTLAYELDDDMYDTDEEEETEVDEEKCVTTLHRVRLDWVNHVRKCLHEKSFSRKYHMSHMSFCKLVNILKPFLERNEGKASRGGYVITCIVIAIGIRYLAGESCTALNDIANISTTSVYCLKNRFIWALSQVEELKIKLPTNAEEWDLARQGLENISSEKLFCGCVGAIDGFFAPIQQPRVNDAKGNPMSIMSGHYGMFGLNCQAVCDACECFLFLVL